MRTREIISVYSSGLCELTLASLGFSTLLLMAMQTISLVAGFSINAEGVLVFGWQIVMLLALWPGQTFWTIRRTTESGFEHSVIGVPSDDDQRVMNHRTARRFSQTGSE